MEMETIGALLLQSLFSGDTGMAAPLRSARFLLLCVPHFMEDQMTPRLHIASQIYARLVLQDLSASIESPTRNAHRALLFADALLLCDQQSAPAIADDRAKREQLETATCPTGHFGKRMTKRRGTRAPLH